MTEQKSFEKWFYGLPEEERPDYQDAEWIWNSCRAAMKEECAKLADYFEKNPIAFQEGIAKALRNLP